MIYRKDKDEIKFVQLDEIFECVIESNYKPIISPNYTHLKTNSNKKKKNKTKKLEL